MGIYLNTEGQRIILQALDQKLQQTITWQSQRITYERIIGRTIHNLEQSLAGDETFHPFKYQM